MKPTSTSNRTRFYSERAEQSDDSECEDDFNFDLGLAGRHRYLGESGGGDGGGAAVEEENNRKIIYPSGTILTIPILEEISTIILPGQDVPINAITSRTQRLLRHVIDSDSRLMGYTLRVTELRRSIPRFERNETSGEIEIGCLLRVRQSNHDEMVVSVVAEAGQRFVVRRTTQDNQLDPFGVKRAQVRILPDSPVNTQRHVQSHHLKWAKKSDKLRRHFSSGLTAHRDMAFATCDERLSDRVRKWLGAWCKRPELVPRSDSALSFWATSQIPSSNLFKATILAHCSPQARLALIDARLNQVKMRLLCRCGHNVSTREQVFVMSNQGASGNYVNPNGYNHEMLTVKKCWSISTQGEPEAAYSWFPGYTWQIINCPECWAHLGWCFRATIDSFKPRMFYGLTKSAIVDGNIELEEDESTTDDEI